jgi:hypothetical protein
VGGAASTTKLTSSQNPSAPGQAVTFTAAVTSVAGIPTGTVTFKDGTTVLSTQTLFDGSATFTTSTLSNGTHSIKAVYGGTTNIRASTSNTVAQVVQIPASEMAALTANLTVPTHYGLTTAALPVRFGVSNGGPASAVSTQLVLTLPAGVSAGTVTATTTNPVASTCSTMVALTGVTTITCTLSAPLSAGQTETFTADVFYPAQGTTTPPPTTVTLAVSTTTPLSASSVTTATGTTTAGSPPASPPGGGGGGGD